MKTRLPRLRDEPLPRPRLLTELQHAHGLRCVVLQAPAGAGKSALLQSWLRKARTAQVHVAGVAPVHGRLAPSLAQRCSDLHPALAFVAQALPVREEDALEAIAIALVRHASVLPRPLAFVFDQLHDLREPGALQALQPLLDYCPPRVQCIFAARQALPLSLGRLRAHGELLELVASDLQWNWDETQQLVRAFLGEPAPEHAAQWLAQTEGWSQGLLSLCRAARAGRPAGEWLDAAFAFLDAQVLSAVPDDQRALFAKLAAAELFDPSLAASLSGRDEGECASLFDRFRAETGFLEQLADGAWWRLQPTLALRLRDRFGQLDTGVRRRAHRCASLHFADAGLQWQAVRQAVLASDARRAADLVEGWAGDLFRDGHHDALAELVRQVPPHVAARSMPLRLWTALLALLEHRDDDCQVMLAALEREAAPADAATRRRIRVMQGWLAVFRDDMASATALFPPEPLPPVPGIDAITLAAERNVLTWIHIYRNDYQGARAVQAGAAAAGAPRGTLFGTLTGRCLAGLSLALEGRMANAERSYREVLDEANACGVACIDPAVLATGLLGETLYELNDLTGVLALEAHLPQLQRRSLPDPFLRVMLVMLRAKAVLGRLDEAMRHARLLEEFARSRRLERLLAYALFERIRLQLLLQDPAAAEPAWAELAGLRKPHAAEEGTALAEVAMVADRAEILLLFYRGRLELARTHIDHLLLVSRRRGRRRRVAALHFQRSAVDHELGDTRSSREHALQGLLLGAQMGLVRSLVDAHPSVPQLLDGALALHGDDESLAFHADRLRAAAGLGPLTSAELGGQRGAVVSPPKATVAQLSEREAQVASRLALALPNKEIARELGLSPETVKWHLHNIYAKLGVATRYAAVTLLREGAKGR